MAFKITISGMSDLIKIIKSTKQYEAKARRLISGLNWSTITGKVRTAVKKEMKRAKYNEKGVRAREIIEGFGVDKYEGVDISAKGHSRTFIVHKPIGDRMIFFKHGSHGKELQSVDSEFILNFMTVGHERPLYFIPKTAGIGTLNFKDKRFGTGDWVRLSKQKLWRVNPVEGRADFDTAINDVMGAWLDNIASKLKTASDEI